MFNFNDIILQELRDRGGKCKHWDQESHAANPQNRNADDAERAAEKGPGWSHFRLANNIIQRGDITVTHWWWKDGIWYTQQWWVPSDAKSRHQWTDSTDIDGGIEKRKDESRENSSLAAGCTSSTSTLTKSKIIIKFMFIKVLSSAYLEKGETLTINALGLEGGISLR